MPNNRVVAEQRALNLKKKLLKNHSFREDYIAFMSDMITKGFAVKFPDEELNHNDGKMWCIPHTMECTTIKKHNQIQHACCI